jgi:hypothetical protein
MEWSPLCTAGAQARCSNTRDAPRSRTAGEVGSTGHRGGAPDGTTSLARQLLGRVSGASAVACLSQSSARSVLRNHALSARLLARATASSATAASRPQTKNGMTRSRLY